MRNKLRRDLSKSELAAVAEGSLRYTGDFGLENGKGNLPFIKRSISNLRGEVHPAGSGDSCLVITAGPSLHRQDPAQEIMRSGYKGTIVAVDAALNYCLRKGLVPNYVVTVDPHHVYIMRWFGDPDFDKRPKDDYFERQELDPALAKNQREKNLRQIELVNRHAEAMKLVIATSVSPNVTRRCEDAGMELYWWNPLYDDWDAPNSYTRRAWEMNKLPCMVGGGNVATAAWVFAHSILAKKHIGLVGMDFAYPPGTDFYNTQRYHEMKEFFGEKDIAKGYIRFRNPHLRQTWFTDPTYAWYRRSFLELAAIAGCTTYNCTEGGIIFGKNIRWEKLSRFLASEKRRMNGGLAS